MKYRKDVTDQEVIADYQRVFKSEIEGFLVPRMNADDGTDDHSTKGSKKPEFKESDGILSDEEKQLLENVFERPNQPVTRRTSMLGLSPYKMNKLKSSVIAKNLAEQFSINLGKDFGGNITLLALTDSGYKVLGKKRSSKKLQNESHEHWWWKEMICRHYVNKKIPAEIEKYVNGKHADVGIRYKGSDIAIEVELSPKNAITNIIQDLNAGFDKVLSCSKNKRILNEIAGQFRALPEHEQFKDKVTLRQLSEFEFIKEILKP
ncbi:hypothetical protein D1BOALGB6SA_7106 [Olavius sp. associated proteobacterium Delta 1]|nr:hypothetical protein D1BOALGB6SA_7106 [Olavius sp. associated proteobacterium Delta 1]